MSEKSDYPFMMDFDSSEDFNVPCELNNLSDFPRNIIEEESGFITGSEGRKLPFLIYDENQENNEIIYKFTSINNNKFITNYYYLQTQNSNYIFIAFMSYINNDYYINNMLFLYYNNCNKYYHYHLRLPHNYNIKFIKDSFIEIDGYCIYSYGTIYNDVCAKLNLPNFSSQDEIFDYIANTYFTPCQIQTPFNFQLKFVD
jgi:hypothetical protein